MTAPGGAPRLDRVTLMPIVMHALLEAGAAPLGDPVEVGSGLLVTGRAGVVVGLPVAKETFGRFGVRCRASVDEGHRAEPEEVVAELGGPLAAMRGAAPTAIAFLERLSAVASGVHEPVPGDVLERYAAALRLSALHRVGDDGPSFRLILDHRPEGELDPSAEAP